MQTRNRGHETHQTFAFDTCMAKKLFWCRPKKKKIWAGPNLCGLIFLHLIADCTAPFIVDVFTDATIDGVAPTAAAPARGLCLEYQQLPC